MVRHWKAVMKLLLLLLLIRGLQLSSRSVPLPLWLHSPSNTLLWRSTRPKCADLSLVYLGVLSKFVLKAIPFLLVTMPPFHRHVLSLLQMLFRLPRHSGAVQSPQLLMLMLMRNISYTCRLPVLLLMPVQMLLLAAMLLSDVLPWLLGVVIMLLFWLPPITHMLS
jgi:hypothetical protein